ncbi:Ppx/GppA phosphatase family protein [Acetobacterium woodii]|uniref:Ppx/GppA phosphatase family protein n=1 Tax=Acetobacterium woodii TaxID=33952 RepID=UPI001FA75D08|nr:Ppx/GppA phosphatase family protein [Acetobacterium woodii]
MLQKVMGKQLENKCESNLAELAIHEKAEKHHLAVIDIGTNSTRMLIFRNDEGKLVRVNKSVRYTRMGQGINQTGKLHPDAEKRNLEALEEFKNIAADYEVEDFYLFGTSAMRDAQNTAAYLAAVKEKLGFEIEVISGEAEAELGFIGVSQCFDEKLLIFDIGGGSTEFIYGEDNEIKKMMSINLGCVRCTEEFIFSDPPSFQELERMNEKIYAEFEKRTTGFLPTKPYKLIGIGGTATSLATIKQKLKTYCSEMVHESTITKAELERIIDDLAGKTIKERQNMVGLEAKRADIILAGAFLLLNIFKITGETVFTVCDYDNLEGAAYRHFVMENS